MSLILIIGISIVPALIILKALSVKPPRWITNEHDDRFGWICIKALICLMAFCLCMIALIVNSPKAQKELGLEPSAITQPLDE